MRRAPLAPVTTAAALAIAALAVATSASADHSTLAAPHIFVGEQAIPASVLGSGFFAPKGIFDLSRVQQDPVMRARRDYSLMAALPTLSFARSETTLPSIETQQWRISEKILLTLPLGLTGRNLIAAEFLGTGRLGLEPTGLAKGGALTFTGAF